MEQEKNFSNTIKELLYQIETDLENKEEIMLTVANQSEELSIEIVFY